MTGDKLSDLIEDVRSCRREVVEEALRGSVSDEKHRELAVLFKQYKELVAPIAKNTEPNVFEEAEIVAFEDGEPAGLLQLLSGIDALNKFTLRKMQ